MGKLLNGFMLGIMMPVILASTALAASVTVVPSGANSYNIQGTGMDGVAGIQLDLRYDSSSFSTPSVTKGALVGGAMLAANTTTPSFIKIAIISTQNFSGSGTIATISNVGPISSITSLMINSQGATLASQASIGDASATTQSGFSSTPGVPFSQTPSTTSSASTATASTVTAPTTNSTTSTSSTTAMVGLGSVTMPTDAMPVSKTEPKTNEPPQIQPANEPAPQPTPEASPVTEAPAKKQEPEKEQEVKQVAYAGILERSRNFQGEMTPTALLAALFSQEIAPDIEQEPPIAISNGKDTLKVIFTLAASEKVAPNFAMTNAKMITLSKNDTSGAWILEARPEKNAVTASVTMLTNSSVVDYPLTVVPPAKGISGKETDFALFLKDTGVKPAKRDLNGDGVHDYQDNYIYAAHYLLLKQNDKKTKPAK